MRCVTVQKIEKSAACGKAFLLPVIAALLVCSTQLQAAFERRSSGARSAGMGGAATSLGWNLWSVNSNPAFAGEAGRSAGFMAMPAVFGLSEFATAAAVWNESFAGWGGALLAEATGNALYREMQFAAAASMPVDAALRLGLSLRYDHLAIARYGDTGCMSIDAGFAWRIDSQIRIGALICNITQARIGTFARELLPVTVAIGASAQLGNEVTLSADVFKDVRYPADLRAGVEFHPFDMLFLRAGATSQPAMWTIGAGIRWGGVDLDYAAVSHADLGLTHVISLAFELSRDAETR